MTVLDRTETDLNEARSHCVIYEIISQPNTFSLHCLRMSFRNIFT